MKKIEDKLFATEKEYFYLQGLYHESEKENKKLRNAVFATTITITILCGVLFIGIGISYAIGCESVMKEALKLGHAKIDPTAETSPIIWNDEEYAFPKIHKGE